MATKKPQVEVTKVPVQQGVDAESAYVAAQTANPDKQWMDETAKAWDARKSAEKENDVVKVEGQAVINLADATGAVGEKTGAALIVADTANSKDAAVVVKKKDDDSHDKGGYIWGGLGVLGLIGIAAAGGGGGDSAPAPAPLNLDGLVIDDPVANAFVFRDVHGDGHLHVIEVEPGKYIVDPDQAVVITNDRGQFAKLSGSGNIISVGINRLPIMVHDAEEIDPSFSDVASEGDLFFASAAKEELGQSINDGELAYIVGEGQVFDSIVISSGIELSVGGTKVTLVTGVTGLVLAYLYDVANGLDLEDESDVTAAIVAVAGLFGFDELSNASSDTQLMSFLLGGYDVAGIDSTGNLNQEIYSLINSLTFAAEAINGESLSSEEHLAFFQVALYSILWAQENRVDDNLSSLATNPEILDQVIEAFFQTLENHFNTYIELVDYNDYIELVDYNDKQLFIDVARNHANLGGGAADIYESLDEYYEYDETNLVNLVQGGNQVAEYNVEVAGNITVLAAGYEQDISLDLDNLSLMGSNILVTASGSVAMASLDITSADLASGTLMSNGTYTFDEDGETTISLGDITVQATGHSSDAHLNFYSSDLTVAGNMLVQTVAHDAEADLDFDWSDTSVVFDDVNVVVNAYGTDSRAFFQADNDDISGVINSIHITAKEDGVNGQLNDGNSHNANQNADAYADIYLNGTVGDITVEALGSFDSADLDLGTGIDTGTPKTDVYNLDEMNAAGWGDLTIGQEVELRVGLDRLTATIAADDFVGNELSVESIINKLKQDPDYADLGILIKESTEDSDEYGIVIRWLEAGSSDVTRLLLAGDSVLKDVDSDGGDNYEERSVFMDNNIITANALEFSSEADIDIEDAVGNIDEIYAMADGEDAGAYIDIELAGLLGDVNVTSDGYDADASVELNSTAGFLEYNSSIINVTALGEDSEADYQQESYAIGDIESISLEAVGSATLNYYGEDYYGEDANNSYYGEDATNTLAMIGGDITINSQIDVYARSDQDQYDGITDGFAVSSRLSLGNLSEDYAMNSIIHLDDVVINVESYGNDAYAELADLYADAVSNYEDQSVITGNITELNVIATGYDSDLLPYDPVVVANAVSSVDLNLHGTIEAINITTDHVSSTNVWLSGDIDVSGLDIDVDSTNSSNADLWLNNLTGDIDLLSTNTSENAYTEVDINLNGAIEQANLFTTTSGSLSADIEITGAGNFIRNLTITTQGSSQYLESTTEASVTLRQESHGGVVNILNGSGSELLADTRLSYSSDYQADIINVNAPFDGTADFFNLEINMTDVDHYTASHQTSLVANMTTINGFTGAAAASQDVVDNTLNNFIQFGDIDDDDYTYQPGEEGTQARNRFEISHYTDGLTGWMGGSNRFDDGEGSRNILNGYYDDFDTFFDAALYGIASEYAFIDLDGIEAANSGGNGGWDAFSTLVELNVTYREFDGTEQTILLDWNAGNSNFWVGGDGQLLNVHSVGTIVSGLSSDINWDESEVVGGENGAWSNNDDNVTLFDNGDGILGIRIGEGTITDVEFKSTWDRVDSGNSQQLGNVSYAGGSKPVDAPISNEANFDSGTADDVAFIEGGGYFFGMVLNAETLGTGNVTYRGVLAMDEDGEGVTKLIELADVLSGLDDPYDNFSSAYIGEAEQEGSMSLFDYNYNASNYDDIGNQPWGFLV